MKSMWFLLAFLLALPCLAEPRLLLAPRDLDRIQRVAQEQPWAGGKTVDLYTKDTAGSLRIFAPQAEVIRVNGRAVDAAHDGDNRKVALR
jgi:hypothetical protein